ARDERGEDDRGGLRAVPEQLRERDRDRELADVLRREHDARDEERRPRRDGQREAREPARNPVSELAAQQPEVGCVERRGPRERVEPGEREEEVRDEPREERALEAAVARADEQRER